jgi:hypothetical protein
MDRVLNSVLDNLFIYYQTPNSLLFFLPPAIFLKSSLLLLQKFLTESVSFDRSSPDPYLALFSHLYCMFLFLFGLLFSAVKLKYNNSRVYYSYCRYDYVADQCVLRRSNSEHFNRYGSRYLCRVHIFCRRDNQYL